MTIVDSPQAPTQKTPLVAAPGGAHAVPGQEGTTSGNRQSWPPPPPPTYSAIPRTDEEAFYRHVRAPREDPPGKRFCKAFIIAIVIWILAGAVIRSIIAVADYSHRRGHRGWFDEYSYPKDISLHHCVGKEGSDWFSSFDQLSSSNLLPSSPPHHASTSFSLPLSSNTLFLVARGTLFRGKVAINTSPTLKGDAARVDITVGYWEENILEYVKVCDVTRRDNENGVGLFTPSRWYGDRRTHEDYVEYFINVTLPESSSFTPLIIKNFETDLPNHNHELGALNNTVTFEKLALKATNGDFEIESLYFKRGAIATTNGNIRSNALLTEQGSIISTDKAIRGTFDAIDSLSLSTTNAAIQARVALKNENDVESSLVMTTTNGEILSIVDLYTKKSGSVPAFRVVAGTTNENVDLAVNSLPVDSKLTLQSTTTNSALTVKLPTTYEGTYTLSTTNYSPALKYQTGVEDPAGRGRQRSVVNRVQTKGSLTGSVYWGEQPQSDKGAVVLSTTNDRVQLSL